MSKFYKWRNFTNCFNNILLVEIDAMARLLLKNSLKLKMNKVYDQLIQNIFDGVSSLNLHYGLYKIQWTSFYEEIFFLQNFLGQYLYLGLLLWFPVLIDLLFCFLILASVEQMRYILCFILYVSCPQQILVLFQYNLKLICEYLLSLLVG